MPRTKNSVQLKKVDNDGNFHVVGTSFMFLAPDTKSAREMLEKSIAHQWQAENLKKVTYESSADLPSTESISFLRKAFYMKISTLIFNLIDNDVPIHEAIAVGNQIASGKACTIYDFAEYAVIAYYIKGNIMEALSLATYR